MKNPPKIFFSIFSPFLAHCVYVERGHDIIDVSLQVGPIQYNGMKDGTPCFGLYNINFFVCCCFFFFFLFNDGEKIWDCLALG